MKLIPFLIALSIVCAPALLLAEHAPDDEAQAPKTPHFVESSLDFDEPLHIGQTITYRAVLEHAPELNITFTYPDETSRWRELTREIQSLQSEETKQTTAEIEYTLLRPGPTIGPPISARVTREGSDLLEHLELPQHPVVVNPIAEEGAQFGDPRAPRELWTERSLTLVYAAGGASLLLLALLAFFALRRRSAYLDEAHQLTPHEAALKALDELRRTSLLADKEFKEFYLRLSEILRRYLGQRFDFPGVEWTTTEITAHLRTLEPTEVEADLDALERWLQAADRVKFAGFTPTPQAAEEHLNQAQNFVESTIPKPPPQDESADGEQAQTQGEPQTGEEPPAQTTEDCP